MAGYRTRGSGQQTRGDKYALLLGGFVIDGGRPGLIFCRRGCFGPSGRARPHFGPGQLLSSLATTATQSPGRTLPWARRQMRIPGWDACTGLGGAPFNASGWTRPSVSLAATISSSSMHGS
jgi:hypothetical protein